MTYELIYDKQHYLLTLDNEGQPVELLVEQDGGPALCADIDTIPQWLMDKVQDQWKVQHEQESL